jgi:hypothetical protein
MEEIMKNRQTNKKNPNTSTIPNKSENSLPGAKHKANYNVEMGEDTLEDVKMFLNNIVDNNDDRNFRLNPNMNRAEIDKATRENQLR